MTGPRQADPETRVALVTGAGRRRGIGRHIALALARSGCDVVVTGSGRAPTSFPADEQEVGWRDVDSVVEEVRRLGRRATGLVLDVTNEADVDAAVAEVVRTMGSLDVLVNNAAAPLGDDRVPLVDLGLDAWNAVLSVKLTGSFLMARAVARYLVAAGREGSIVNVSSVAGKSFPADMSAYVCANTGVQALSAALARELGPRGIRVNAVCPGPVETHRMDGAALMLDAIVEQLPLGRASDGSDVGELVAFLCSQQGRWITGQVISVDGGMFVGH